MSPEFSPADPVRTYSGPQISSLFGFWGGFLCRWRQGLERACVFGPISLRELRPSLPRMAGKPPGPWEVWVLVCRPGADYIFQNKCNTISHPTCFSRALSFLRLEIEYTFPVLESSGLVTPLHRIDYRPIGCRGSGAKKLPRLCHKRRCSCHFVSWKNSCLKPRDTTSNDPVATTLWGSQGTKRCHM